MASSNLECSGRSSFNLLSNAVKFTGSGGRIEVGARREGRDLVVEVRDTGVGIAVEDQQKIFQEFFQVDSSYSRKHLGTGLGLALVRRMVGLHGGSLSLTSAPGEGSCFAIRFPECLSDAPVPPRPAIERPSIPAARAERSILVVEDNAINRKLARNALRARGYRVIEAATGEEALDLVHRMRPDLILMDPGTGREWSL